LRSTGSIFKPRWPADEATARTIQWLVQQKLAFTVSRHQYLTDSVTLVGGM
jgi:hypothetical protein